MGGEKLPSQQNGKIAAILDAPEIALADDETAGDGLLKFYRALGWDGEGIVDPCKVRTTKAVYIRLFNLMLEKCPDSLIVGFALANKGPGVDEGLPPNKVILLDGWIKK